MARREAKVTLELPRMLEPVAGTIRMTLAGRTVAEALEAAFDRAPVLRHHLLADDGSLRSHVLCMRNGATVPRGALARTELADGDVLAIVQAISGG